MEAPSHRLLKKAGQIAGALVVRSRLTRAEYLLFWVLVSLERVLGLKSGELVARVTPRLSKGALGAGRNREASPTKRPK